MLKTWASPTFAVNNGNQDQLQFSITLPDTGSKCRTAGECVVQHHWHSDLADQTYQSCVDFVLSGGNTGGATTTTATPTQTATQTGVQVITQTVTQTVTRTVSATGTSTAAARFCQLCSEVC
ncbi:hypothetical protein HK097_006557 [Rhizophlyctis rosea]|uniref:Chitin-binding type-4 domain-containing protein n=1 Tax=Rhizophlyctis rosea TaxID=64517 RepID=A0AAD5SE18_9FUNG|nr:hypothetical protein HK097_006557 [Rhizophlyctis rosea]